MARILYLCSANQAPTGGNKITYRHVSILNDLGYEALVLHPKSGFRYPSLSHQPPVIGIDQWQPDAEDLVVLPEDAGPGMCSFARGLRKIIFNQNAYYSFRGFEDLNGPLPPYGNPEFIATLAISEDNQRYLEHAFPGLRCRRLRLSIDFDRFQRVPVAAKKNQIAFMTRKNSADIIQVLQILRSRRSLGDWRLIAIENQDEAGVARLMGEAKIFLAFGHPEGISLSNLEAMACGCRVIGYSGMGCREYFSDDRCLEIETGDILAFVHAVEAEIKRFDHNAAALLASLEAAGRHVRDQFSSAAERSDLQDFYGELLGPAP